MGKTIDLSDLVNTKLDIIFLVFLLLEVHQPIRGRWQTVQCSTGTAVRADAGSYFLKGISSRGQIATDNCQFLRLKRRRSSEENQRSAEERESEPRQRLELTSAAPTCHL